MSVFCWRNEDWKSSYRFGGCVQLDLSRAPWSEVNVAKQRTVHDKVVLQQSSQIWLPPWAEQKFVYFMPQLLKCLVRRGKECLCDVILAVIDLDSDVGNDQTLSEGGKIGAGSQKVRCGIWEVKHGANVVNIPIDSFLR